METIAAGVFVLRDGRPQIIKASSSFEAYVLDRLLRPDKVGGKA